MNEVSQPEPASSLFSRKHVIAGVVIFILLAIGAYFLYRGVFGNEVLKKQTAMLKITQGLSQTEAEKKATEEIARTEKIKKEATKRGITVSTKEVDQEAQRIISQSSKELVLRTLNQYGWTEADWKTSIVNTILAEKLSEEIAGWRDYQLLMVRWDNPAKPKFESEEIAWLQAKAVLDKARLQLEKGTEIQTVFALLKADKSVTSYFEVQAAPKTQRIWSYTQIPSIQLKEYIFATPLHTISPVLRVGGYALLIKTFDGKDGGGSSLDDFLQKTQGFQFPSLAKSAYALTDEEIKAHIRECAADGRQYCLVRDACYTEAVITGKVADPAGNAILGAQVSAHSDKTNEVACQCTSSSSSATSGGDGRYDIHGLCCFVSPFNVTATKDGFSSCTSHVVETVINGNTYPAEDIVCIPNTPSAPTVASAPSFTPTPTLTPGAGTPTEIPQPPTTTPVPGVPTDTPVPGAPIVTPTRVPSATSTPVPTSTISPATCQCTGLSTDNLIVPGANVTFNAKAQVSGDTRVKEIRDFAFSFYELGISPSLIRIAGPVTVLARLVPPSSSSLNRYQSDWNFTIPTLKSNVTYQVRAVPSCVQKVAIAPRRPWYEPFINLFARLSGTAIAQNQQLQLKPFQPTQQEIQANSCIMQFKLTN